MGDGVSRLLAFRSLDVTVLPEFMLFCKDSGYKVGVYFLIHDLCSIYRNGSFLHCLIPTLNLSFINWVFVEDPMCMFCIIFMIKCSPCFINVCLNVRPKNTRL